MATSVLMASSHDHNTSHTLSEDHHHHPNHLQTKTAATSHDHYQAGKQSNISTPRRRLTRANDNKKKQPQRGMGVAQLERLRLGERWKKMNELNHNNNNTPSPLPCAVIPASFANDPTSLSTVPLHLAKYGTFSSSTSAVSGVGGLNFNQPAALVVPRVGLFHGQGLVSDDNFQGNLYGVGNGSETSKELSSTPNMINTYSDRCSVCHQKKRNFFGQNLVYKGVKDINAEMTSSNNSSGFAGFNVGNSQKNKSRTTLVFGKNASFQAGSTYSVRNIDQGIVDVATVHRKGSSSGSGSGSFFMEYEFFPVASGKGSKIDSHESENELMMMMMKKAVGGSDDHSSVAAVMMGGDGNTSCVTTTTACGGVGLADASSSIDLSLRLSY